MLFKWVQFCLGMMMMMTMTITGETTILFIYIHIYLLGSLFSFNTLVSPIAGLRSCSKQRPAPDDHVCLGLPRDDQLIWFI